jgi:hypothetical protein
LGFATHEGAEMFDQASYQGLFDGRVDENVVDIQADL